MRCSNCQMPRRNTATYCTYCGKPHSMLTMSFMNANHVGDPDLGCILGGILYLLKQIFILFSLFVFFVAVLYLAFRMSGISLFS